jgi:protein-S-isoprenylcysteine O-methyltransferase Ste14
MKLSIQTLGTFLLGAIALGVLLFLPAWTLAYWQAWVFIVVFMASVNAIGVYLAITSSLGLLVFCAFDHRFAWSAVPAPVSVVGDVLVALGLLINLVVFRENTYGASTIKVEEGQKVISTGLYARVRHPMYVGILVMIMGIPLALGSWWGLAILAITTPVLAWRIIDEEKLLSNDLAGYKEYTQKVRYRLVPYLW